MGTAGPQRDPAASFAAAMAAAGPFEAAPHLAVALSGGADSTSLTLFARDWAAARGGVITALTIDHGLRAGSDQEARAAGTWCARHGIAHEVLRWTGDKPARAIQEKARAARYELLEAWCRDAGVLHLLVGHHADDQGETIAMRAAKGSGEDGLAGMALIAERTHMRLLRPLLAVEGTALRAWLQARGERWVEDPSNRDPRFLRSRMRGPAGVPAAIAMHPAARAAAERQRADWLGAHAAVHPEGWASVDHRRFMALPEALAAAVLRAAVLAVSGDVHPPRGSALTAATVWARVTRVTGSRSIHGCILAVDEGRLAILRNPAAVRAVTHSGADMSFDGRFRLRWSPARESCAQRVIALWKGRPAAISAKRAPCLLAGASLPAVQALDGSVGVLHVLYGRGSLALVSVDSMNVSFRPVRPLAGAAFAGLQTAKLSSTPESLAGAERSAPRLPERVVPP